MIKQVRAPRRSTVVAPEKDLTWYLLFLSTYFDQETEKRPFRRSSQAATCYYLSDYSKIEASC